jgi:two-component system sensor histidine kinase YesM
MVSYDELNRELRHIQIGFIIQTILVILLSMVLLIFIAKKISLPILRLSHHMEQGDYGTLPAIYSGSSGVMEIRKLIQSYNILVESIGEYMEKIKIAEGEKREANFQALQAQINPHFLFNTLNSIKWMCYMNGDRKAGDLLTSLGALYEIAINRESDFISIKNEEVFLSHYIALINARYEVNIALRFEYDPSLSGCRILKFIIQPIVENSIIHGFEDCMGRPENTVFIRVTGSSGILTIAVADNGRGMSEEKLMELQDTVQKKEGDKFSGVGLSNVERRIKLHYGDNFGVTLNNLPRGTQTIITLPLLPEGHRL